MNFSPVIQITISLMQDTYFEILAAQLVPCKERKGEGKTPAIRRHPLFLPFCVPNRISTPRRKKTWADCGKKKTVAVLSRSPKKEGVIAYHTKFPLTSKIQARTDSRYTEYHIFQQSRLRCSQRWQRATLPETSGFWTHRPRVTLFLTRHVRGSASWSLEIFTVMCNAELKFASWKIGSALSYICKYICKFYDSIHMYMHTITHTHTHTHTHAYLDLMYVNLHIYI